MGMRETWNLKFGWWKFHELWILWIIYPSLHLNHGNHPWMFFGASAAAMAMRAAAVLDRKTIGKWCCYHGKLLVNAGFTMGKSINNVKYAAYAWIKWDVHPSNRKWLITHPGDLWGHWTFSATFHACASQSARCKDGPMQQEGKILPDLSTNKQDSLAKIGISMDLSNKKGDLANDICLFCCKFMGPRNRENLGI